MVLCVYESEQSTEKDIIALSRSHMPDPVLGTCLHITQFDTSYNLEHEVFFLNLGAKEWESKKSDPLPDLSINAI